MRVGSSAWQRRGLLESARAEVIVALGAPLHSMGDIIDDLERKRAQAIQGVS